MGVVTRAGALEVARRLAGTDVPQARVAFGVEGHSVDRFGIEYDMAGRYVEPAPRRDPGLLTPDEHDLVRHLGVAYDMWCGIVGDGHSRAGDCTEFAAHVHDLQNAVLANAAARAYPDRYRLAGGPSVERTVVGP